MDLSFEFSSASFTVLIKILSYAALTASVNAFAVAAMPSQSLFLIFSWSNAGATKPTEDAPFLK
jgi:hypothetical protein